VCEEPFSTECKEERLVQRRKLSWVAV
jgi:hypothetical protein